MSDTRLLQETIHNINVLETQMIELQAAIADRKHKSVPNNYPGDRWKQGWIFELDLLCRLLTGLPLCKNSGLSYRFIELAYKSIGGEIGVKGTNPSAWSSAVKTAHLKFDALPEAEIEARNRGQRYTAGRTKLAVSKENDLDYDARQAKEAVSAALLGSPFHRYYATFLFDRSDERMKAYIDSLGWTADFREKNPADVDWTFHKDNKIRSKT